MSLDGGLPEFLLGFGAEVGGHTFTNLTDDFGGFLAGEFDEADLDPEEDALFVAAGIGGIFHFDCFQDLAATGAGNSHGTGGVGA
ncbi:MAG: hypothetical protein ACO4AI_15640, partial [Prochlorothrix sp.]